MTDAGVGRREVMILAVAITCLAAAVFELPLADDDIPGLAVSFALAWAICLMLLVTNGRGGLYRPSAGYLVVFGLFHGGLLVSIALRGPEGFTAYDTSWLYSGYTPSAVRLAILGMATFALVAELAAGRSRHEAPEGGVPPFAGGTFAIAGLGVELVGIAIFAGAVAQAGGLDLVSGGYATFLQANESDGLLGYGTLLIGLGAVLAVTAGGPARTAAWVGLSGYAAVAFLIGTRGAVLFPLLAVLAVEVRRGCRIRPLWTVLGVAGLLVLIGLVRTTRMAGFGALASSVWSSPLDAIAEMGYSLRPTVVVLDWHSSGEPYRHGATLVAVPVRFLEAMTGWHGGPPAFDDRLFNVEILHRIGPIGGSPVAEAYHNAGVAGVVLFMAAVGLVLGRLERRPANPFSNAMVGIVLLPPLIQVRNSFAPVPAQLAIGLLLLCLVHVMRQRADRHGSPALEVRA